jgi:cytochrome P450
VCRATDEDGQALDPQQIADHMIFLMMAAHDTITSSLTATVWQLGLNPEWQERLREEAAGSGSVDDLHLCDQAFREALRLMAPVPSIPPALREAVPVRRLRRSGGHTDHRLAVFRAPDGGDLARSRPL